MIKLMETIKILNKKFGSISWFSVLQENIPVKMTVSKNLKLKISIGENPLLLSFFVKIVVAAKKVADVIQKTNPKKTFIGST